jgi:hypothetical protein
MSDARADAAGAKPALRVNHNAFHSPVDIPHARDAHGLQKAEGVKSPTTRP